MAIRKIIILVTMLALTAGLVIFSQNRSKAVAVSTEAVSKNVIQPSILASGTLTHENEVRLSSEVIGKVAEVLVVEGEGVTAGQLVLRVDDQNFIAAVEQAKAQVTLSKIDIDRQKSRINNLKKTHKRKEKLHNQSMVGDDEFEALAHQLQLAKIDLKSSVERLRQAEAQLEQALDRLRKTKIISPISGIVTSLDIKVGETAIASSTNIPGSSLMTIANPASIYTEVLVDEADIAGIALGQTAEIVAIAYPEQPMQGKIKFIANTAKIEPGRQSLSFTVEIELVDTGDVVLRPGMSCRAEIMTGTNAPSATVRLKAVRVEEDNDTETIKHFVYVFNDGIAEKRELVVGMSDDQNQQVLSGVSEGELIITGPTSELRKLVDGAEVELLKESKEEDGD